MIVQVFASLAIVALVLIQRGKGADAGAGFGAGASGTVFGARGARTALSRATAVFAAVFMLNSLALAYMGTRSSQEQPKTLLDEVASEPAPSVNPDATATQPQLAPEIPSVPAPAPSSGETVPAPAPNP
jgi:preprotein translocase subunit SecG